MRAIDLNSDLGESFGAWDMGDDAAMLDIVTSANVACGFHAGDPAGILRTLKAAVAKNVTIGAHVSYPDKVGFGRRNMDVASDELTADVIYQIGSLQGLAKAAGTSVRYVKPHGALYNTIAHDRRQAMAVIEAIRAIDPTLVLVALAGSSLIELARSEGLQCVAKAFEAKTGIHVNVRKGSSNQLGQHCAKFLSAAEQPGQLAQAIQQPEPDPDRGLHRQHR